MNIVRFTLIAVTLLISFYAHAENGLHHVTNDLPSTSETIGNPSVEFMTISKLIESTQRLLDNQLKLRISIKKFQELQASYLKDTENKELLLKVAKGALLVSDEIKETHLEYAFSPEFLSEVSLFAKFATKRNVPSPVIK